MAQTITYDTSQATGSTNPAQQSPANQQFQTPWWLNLGGQIVSQGVQFLASDAGECWKIYPPFSGNGDLRRECLRRVRAGQVYGTQVGTHGGVNTAGIANIATYGLLAFLGYQLLKK